MGLFAQMIEKVLQNCPSGDGMKSVMGHSIELTVAELPIRRPFFSWTDIEEQLVQSGVIIWHPFQRDCAVGRGRKICRTQRERHDLRQLTCIGKRRRTD